VRYLIYTDHHPDHTFGNGFLKGEVIGHHGTRELMEAGAAEPAALQLLDPLGYATHIEGKNYKARSPSITFDDTISNIEKLKIRYLITGHGEV
jgi:glyoxylase-like metal-dependent hydrolase (beta-lactamase superfamily II)